MGQISPAEAARLAAQLRRLVAQVMANTRGEASGSVTVSGDTSDFIGVSSFSFKSKGDSGLSCSTPATSPNCDQRVIHL